MKPFLIAFRHDIGWDLRYIIARATGAPVHCVMIHGDRCFDMTFDGLVERSTADRLTSGRWEVFTIPAADEAAAADFSRGRLGWKYDWFGVLWAWWAGRLAGNALRKRMFCSEHCAGALTMAGVLLLFRREARYTPRRLRDELRNRFRWEATWINP